MFIEIQKSLIAANLSVSLILGLIGAPQLAVAGLHSAVPAPRKSSTPIDLKSLDGATMVDKVTGLYNDATKVERPKDVTFTEGSWKGACYHKNDPTKSQDKEVGFLLHVYNSGNIQDGGIAALPGGRFTGRTFSDDGELARARKLGSSMQAPFSGKGDGAYFFERGGDRSLSFSVKKVKPDVGAGLVLEGSQQMKNILKRDPQTKKLIKTDGKKFELICYFSEFKKAR